MCSRDIDRQVSSYARRSWNNCIFIPLSSSPTSVKSTESVTETAKERDESKLVLEGEFVTGLLSFVQRAVIDPTGLYLYLNPTQATVGPQVQTGAGSGRSARGRGQIQVKREEPVEVEVERKVEIDEESETDRRARLRIGGLGVLQYLMGKIFRV